MKAECLKADTLFSFLEVAVATNTGA